MSFRSGDCQKHGINVPVNYDSGECQQCASDSKNLFDGYQFAMRRTRPAGELKAPRLACWALGLTGESGEVADIVKKHLAQGHELSQTRLVEELGDVLWYVAAIADELGVQLSAVARANVEKLAKRYPEGFSVERSVARPAGR